MLLVGALALFCATPYILAALLRAERARALRGARWGSLVTSALVLVLVAEAPMAWGFGVLVTLGSLHFFAPVFVYHSSVLVDILALALALPVGTLLHAGPAVATEWWLDRAGHMPRANARQPVALCAGLAVCAAATLAHAWVFAQIIEEARRFHID